MFPLVLLVLAYSPARENNMYATNWDLSWWGLSIANVNFHWMGSDGVRIWGDPAIVPGHWISFLKKQIPAFNYFYSLGSALVKVERSGSSEGPLLIGVFVGLTVERSGKHLISVGVYKLSFLEHHLTENIGENPLIFWASVYSAPNIVGFYLSLYHCS